MPSWTAHALAVTLPLAMASTIWSAPARAQGGDPSAVAETLFQSGRELMAAGHFADACPKFAESNRIDPKLGTLMNLALCHEKAGSSASAWAEYVEAAGIARRLGQAERERVARERAKALEGTLVHVVIDASAGSDAQVTLDGQVIGPGGFGTPIAVDPGDHVVRATAPGKTAFSESFRVAEREDHTTHVPALEAAPAAAAALPAPAPVVPVAAPETHDHGGRRTAGFVVGAAGVVLLGVGGVFGVRAFSEKHTVEDECDAVQCTPAGRDASSSMKTSETVSTIAVLAGVAAVGAGTYLWLSAGRGTQVGVGPAGRGVRLAVTW